MSVKVKICGVRTPDILEAASESGADYVGFVFFARSPRHLSIDQAGHLAQAARGRIGTVAVLVDPDDALVDHVVEAVTPDLLQLHGDETPERVRSIKLRSGLPVMKAIPVAKAGDAAGAEAYEGIADHILFDAKAASGAAVPGGHGIPFDWRALAAVRSPFVLSGGLNVSNVAAAIGLTGASMVDVSSGVEVGPGVKDANLIRAFVAAAKSAAEQHRVKAS